MATETTTDVAPRGENFYVHALLGAVVTVVISFVPFSPIVGGGVAGYLQDEGTGRGTRVGAVSGIIASLPLAALFVFLLAVMSFGSIVSGEFAGPFFVVALIGAVLLAFALYTVGFGATGGYLGAELAKSRAEKRDAAVVDRSGDAGDDDPETVPDVDERSSTVDEER